jgi:hypothetical protein
MSALECSSNPTGISNYMITKINPTIEINPILKTLADFNWYTAVTSEKFYSVEISKAGSTVKLFIPRAQINSSSIADSNGFMRNTMSFRCLLNLDNKDIPVGWNGGSVATSFPTIELSSIPYYLYIGEVASQY